MAAAWENMATFLYAVLTQEIFVKSHLLHVWQNGQHSGNMPEREV